MRGTPATISPLLIFFVLSYNPNQAQALDEFLTTLDPSLMAGLPALGPQPSTLHLVHFGPTLGYVVGSNNGSDTAPSAVAVASKDGYVVQAFVSLGANPVPTAKQALRDALGRLQNSR